MYIRAVNGNIVDYPFGIDQLLKEHPEKSWPRGLEYNHELLAEYDVYPVVQANRPVFDARTQKIRQAEQPEYQEGKWILPWIVEDFTEEETRRNDYTAREFVRRERNRYLTATDWMALSDNKMTPEWAEYRQALRDVTKQPGFPHNIDWPTPPER